MYFEYLMRRTERSGNYNTPRYRLFGVGRWRKLESNHHTTSWYLVSRTNGAGLSPRVEGIFSGFLLLLSLPSYDATRPCEVANQCQAGGPVPSPQEGKIENFSWKRREEGGKERKGNGAKE